MNGKFDFKYRKIIVHVSIKGIDKIAKMRFILDTGASFSIINTNAMKSLGYTKKDFTKTERLQGFGGNRKNVNFLKLKSLAFLGVQRNNFEIGAADFSSNMLFDGILGIDFFKNHKLCIDLKKGFISLD